MVRGLGAVAILVGATLLTTQEALAQNRGVYPLGMSAVNSGVITDAGFGCSFQFLDYSRDRNKDNDGRTLPVMGRHAVLMFLSTFTWSTQKLHGFQGSASATIPIASNNLSTEVTGNISGGTGFGDSYFVPVIVGWSNERIAVRVMYGFLAPTGRFSAEGTDNVGSGYWTHTISAGQTFYPLKNKRLVFSAFEMYEFHSTQEGTGTHPGQTWDFDYSLMGVPLDRESVRMQLGVVGYEQSQTTATVGPTVSPSAVESRYLVNALGGGMSVTMPKRKVTLGFRLFDELGNRSTFEGYAIQISGAIGF